MNLRRWSAAAILCVLGCSKEEPPQAGTPAGAPQAQSAPQARSTVAATAATTPSAPAQPSVPAVAVAPPTSSEPIKPALPPRPLSDRTRIARLTPAAEAPTHATTVYGVDYSSTGKLATISEDLQIKITTLPAGPVLNVKLADLKPDDKWDEASVAFSPDGKLLAVGLRDEVRLLYADDGTEVRRLKGNPEAGYNGFTKLSFTPGGERVLAVAGPQYGLNLLYAWTTAHGRQLQTYPLGKEYRGYRLAPDGQTFACAGKDDAVELRDLASGAVVHRFTGSHDDEPTFFAYSPDARHLAVLDDKKRLVLYDLAERKELLRIDEYGYLYDLDFTPDGLLAATGNDFRLHFLDGKQLHEVLKFDVDGYRTAFSPDAKQVAACGDSDNHRASLFDLTWSQEERTLATGERVEINAAVASPDGKWLAWAESTWNSEQMRDFGVVSLFSVADGKVTATESLDGRVQRAVPLHFSPDGKMLAVSVEGKDKDELRLLAVPDGKLVRSLSVDDDSLDEAPFTPDGKHVVVCENGQVRLWNVATGDEEKKDKIYIWKDYVQFVGADRVISLEGYDGEMRVASWPEGKLIREWDLGHGAAGFAMSPDGKRLTTLGPYGVSLVKIWDVETGTVAMEFDLKPKVPTAITYSADGQWILTGDEKGFVQISSAADGAPRGEFLAQRNKIKGICFVPGTSQFVTYDDRNFISASLRLWNLDHLLKQIPAPPPKAEPPVITGLKYRSLYSSSHHPCGWLDGGKSVYANNDSGNVVSLFDVVSGTTTRSIEVDDAKWIEVSPDGAWLAAAYDHNSKFPVSTEAKRGAVRIWDFRTGKVQHTLILESGEPVQLAFAPDGKTLAVASGGFGGYDAGELSLWDVAAGTRKQYYPEPKLRTSHVRYSPDGSLLASAGYGKQVTVRKASDGAVVFQHAFGHPIHGLQFSADGKRLYICGGDSKHGAVATLNVADGAKLPFFADFNEETHAVAESPDGKLFAVACFNDRGEQGYRFYELPDGKPIRFLAHESYPEDGTMSFSPDGRMFLATVIGELGIWKLDDLFDLPLQRDLQKLRERNLTVEYVGDLLRVEYGMNQATDRELKSLPTLTRPFALKLGVTSAVTDAGLQELLRQKNLVDLDLTGCREFSVEGLKSLASLPLRRLAYDSNRAEFVAVLPAFANLESLTLSYFQEEPQSEALAPLTKLTKLRDLKFGGFSAPGSALDHVAKLPQLESLSLGYADLGDDDLRRLAPLVNLRHFQINGEKGFTGAGLAHLAGAKKLERIDLSHNKQVADAGLASLKTMTQLRDLNLYDTKVGDAGLAQLADLTELRVLQLPEGAVTDAGLQHLAKLKSLSELGMLPEYSGVTGSGFAALADAAAVTDLNLSRQKGLTDDGVRGVAQMKQLRVLRLPPQITDAGLAHLATLTNLTELYLDETKVTDAGMAQLTKLPNLRRLSIRETGITDAAVPHFIALKNLVELVIERSKMTKTGKQAIEKAFPRERYLFVND